MNLGFSGLGWRCPGLSLHLLPFGWGRDYANTQWGNYSHKWHLLLPLIIKLCVLFLTSSGGMQWTWPNINKILASCLCENGTSSLIAVVFSSPVLSDSLWPHGQQHARHPCPSPSPEVCPSSCPLHWWCRPAISSSDTLFSFCPQSFPTSGTFPMSHLFASVHFSSNARSCLTLCDSMDSSTPGFPVHHQLSELA